MRFIFACVPVDLDLKMELKGLDSVQIGEVAYQDADIDHSSALMAACKSGDYIRVLRLISRSDTGYNININLQDYDMRTPLHLACA